MTSRDSRSSAGYPDRSALDAALCDLEHLFAEVDEHVSALPFECRGDGDCCRFSRSGHRLYITWLEAWCLFGGTHDFTVGEDCPFQDRDLCTRRKERSLGCRVYGCDPAHDGPAASIYEAFHDRIGAIHEKHGLPYEYRDIREWARIFSGSPS